MFPWSDKPTHTACTYSVHCTVLFKMHCIDCAISTTNETVIYDNELNIPHPG